MPLLRKDTEEQGKRMMVFTGKRPEGKRWCTTHARWADEKGGCWIFPKMPPKRGTNKRWACAECMANRRKVNQMKNTLPANP